ncbi:DUF2156 domain-containing protein (plasmid) [Rhizobium acidisoli]|uniref:DUF2156 domain-containing protein n=1 Tax=Rhizobium acidisoli TaxID=1538158 RepID=A0AAE5WTQ5_9HYPH|nr:phosphatidylglycerol lysyltransferase domain-containing protein [Rhizobium acidisoli]KPH04626.1 hypothetical protein AOG23_32125 [Rhizobium acidisoli]QAS82264.1 DUF2156 domain-containing protein [Rhizobium acidisoli]
MARLRKFIDTCLDRSLPAISSVNLTVEQRLSLCRQYGDFSLAYSTAVQPDLNYFGDEDGYIAYATKMGHVFALGDPVASPGRRAHYLAQFIAQSGKPCFVQIHASTAAELASHGYRLNQMGKDSALSLPTHSFTGKRNETLRYSERWLHKNGYTIHECGDGEFVAELTKISDDWRAGRIVRRREMRFLNRPFRLSLTPGMRRFVLLSPHAKPIALLDFDPLFRGGKAVGYTAAFKRKFPGTTAHAEIGLTKYAADRFRQEGSEIMTLGLSPLAGVEKSQFRDSTVWRYLYQRAFVSSLVNRRIFNVQGQAAFKRRFHGKEVQTYIGFKRGTPTETVALLRLLKTF